MKTNFKIGDILICIDNKLFEDKEVAPPLIEGNEYIVKEIITTKGDHDHLNVGLQSIYNWITCRETEVQIPKGDVIHWCHPSRFKLKE